MRTTITLDDDLYEALRDLSHEKRQPLKRVLNDALRNGLGLDAPAPKRFVVKATDMGVPFVDLTKANALAFALEDEAMLAKMKERDEAARRKRSAQRV